MPRRHKHNKSSSSDFHLVGVVWGDADIESPWYWQPTMAIIETALENLARREAVEEWKQIMSNLGEPVDKIACLAPADLKNRPVTVNRRF